MTVVSAPPPAEGLAGVAKASTGIAGLDEITAGGLPRGRTTLICGGAGSGKTLMALQFVVRGALDSGEPGVFVAFEESAAELAANVASLGWDLENLQARNLLLIDQVRLGETDIRETGEWDLEGLFIRLSAAVEAVGAKRIVLDSIESLFAVLHDETLLRSELRRLFRWLSDRGLTAVVTGERGEGMLTRHGLEEYVSDCVILLDHRVNDQISTRRLRVVKYRGSHHGPDEYPFLIDRDGFTVVPASGMSLAYDVSEERVSTGVAELDSMLGEGFYRGSTVLVSGTPGSGKTTLAAQFVACACARGERALFFTFEESPSQIARNMRSAGIDLAPHIDAGLLQVIPVRPTWSGLEAHLARITRLIDDFDPAAVVLDPISSLDGEAFELKSVLARLIDEVKGAGITGLMTTLTHGRFDDQAGLGVSSLIDTWIDLRNVELDGERNRGLNILKSRGMGHSNQIREFRISHRGLEIVDVYAGERGVLMGSAREAQEARDREASTAEAASLETKRRTLAQRRVAIEAQIAALEAQLEAETINLSVEITDGERRELQGVRDRADRVKLRGSRARDEA